MSFLNLPLEIHKQIISYLISNRDVAALSIQCCALHSICDMATRKKYHRISVSSGEQSIDRAFDFLMEILKRPTLGLYVRHVECHEPLSWYTDYEETKPMRDLSSDEITLIRGAVRKAGFVGLKEDRVVNMLMQRLESEVFHYER
jgi:hypothetical protein